MSAERRGSRLSASTGREVAPGASGATIVSGLEWGLWVRLRKPPPRSGSEGPLFRARVATPELPPHLPIRTDRSLLSKIGGPRQAGPERSPENRVHLEPMLRFGMQRCVLRRWLQPQLKVKRPNVGKSRKTRVRKKAVTAGWNPLAYRLIC